LRDLINYMHNTSITSEFLGRMGEVVPMRPFFAMLLFPVLNVK
jgi:hypothetical protein